MSAVTRPPLALRLLVHVTLGLPTLWLALGTLFTALRRPELVDLIRGVDVKSTVGLVVAGSVVYALANVTLRDARVDGFAVTFGVMIAYALALGVAALAQGDEGYGLRFLVPHVSAAALMLGGYVAFASWPASGRAWLLRTFDRYAVLVVGVMTVYLVVFVLDWLTRSTYWGPSTGPLLFPFAWFVLRRRPWPAALAALLIVANGKRGPAVALLAEALVLLALRWPHLAPRTRRRFVLGFAAVGALLVAGIAQLVALVAGGDAPAALAATILKWQVLNPGAADFDPNYATAGRLVEVQTAFQAFGADPLRWWTGAGYGWSFKMYGGLEDLHFLHFSPLNFVLQYGAPLAATFFGAVAWRLVRAARAARALPGGDPLLELVVVLVVGALVEGLFAYMYAVNPLLWIALGLLAALAPRAAARATSRPLGAPLPT